jgi:hypothetical protein
MYHANLREFDPGERAESALAWKPDRPSTYVSNTPRRPLFAVEQRWEISEANVSKPAKVKGIDIRRQGPQSAELPADGDRVYELADAQRDRLRPRQPNYCDMKKQRPRDTKHKNKRLETLARLERQQRDFLNGLKPERSAIQPPPRAETSFAVQTPRGRKTFPDEKIDDTPREFWPYDPVKSLKATRPRVHSGRIGDREKPLGPKEFWEVRRGRSRRT